MYVLPSLAVKRLVCICVGCGLAAELCKKLRQEQCQMRDEAEQLNNEIRSLEADVRYTSTDPTWLMYRVGQRNRTVF